MHENPCNVRAYLKYWHPVLAPHHRWPFQLPVATARGRKQIEQQRLRVANFKKSELKTHLATRGRLPDRPSQLPPENARISECTTQLPVKVGSRRQSTCLSRSAGLVTIRRRRQLEPKRSEGFNCLKLNVCARRRTDQLRLHA